MSAAPPGQVRLQKFLSDAGVASRRHAEELILEGRVLVNGRVVDALPAFVDPQTDKVIVDGTRVRLQRREYFLVHKPKGVVCTNDDPSGRIRAVDLLPPLPMPLFPVGRLDAECTGLLLMTNDGELAQRITHPRHGVPRTYRAEVRGRVPLDLPAQMKKGVYLAEGRAQASDVEVVHASYERSVLMITLREGPNRQVRRMLARLGYPVRTLKRVQIGSLSLRGLPVGASRRLTSQELSALQLELEAGPVARPTGRGQRRPPKAATRRAGKPQTNAAGRTRSGSPRSSVPAGRPRSAESPGRGGPGRRLIT